MTVEGPSQEGPFTMSELASVEPDLPDLRVLLAVLLG